MGWASSIANRCPFEKMLRGYAGSRTANRTIASLHLRSECIAALHEHSGLSFLSCLLPSELNKRAAAWPKRCNSNAQYHMA